MSENSVKIETNINSKNNSNNKQNSNNSKNVGKKRKMNQTLSDNEMTSQNSRTIVDNQSTRSHHEKREQWHRLTGAPAWDLPPCDWTHEQTFTGRCRLFVANLPQNVSEEMLRQLFSEFGQISEIFIGKGNQFSFIKMDKRENAEKAKHSLDGKLFEGRNLRVRLAAHASAVRVTQLPPFATNELLALAFSSFGTVERAIVSTDDRGRSLGEGIVEFARKSSSLAAIKKCQNESLMLSLTPIPVVVTPLESRDEEEGVLEKSFIHLNEYRNEREIGPRFADIQNGLEFQLCQKWKQLFVLENEKREELEKELKDLRNALKQEMEVLKAEQTVRQLREELLRMENRSQKLFKEREQLLESEKQRMDERREREMLLRQQEAELLRPMTNSSDDLIGLRRQESELRQQANALQQLLDRQEAALRQVATPVGHSDSMLPNINHQSGLNQLDPQLSVFNGGPQTAQSQNSFTHSFNSFGQNFGQRNHSLNQMNAQFPQQLNAQQLYGTSGGPSHVGANQISGGQQHSQGGGRGGQGQGMKGFNFNQKRNRRF